VLIGLEPRHFQNLGQRLEPIAPRRSPKRTTALDPIKRASGDLFKKT
jgi:hypothetical protein